MVTVLALLPLIQVTAVVSAGGEADTEHRRERRQPPPWPSHCGPDGVKGRSWDLKSFQLRHRTGHFNYQFLIMIEAVGGILLLLLFYINQRSQETGLKSHLKGSGGGRPMKWP